MKGDAVRKANVKGASGADTILDRSTFDLGPYTLATGLCAYETRYFVQLYRLDPTCSAGSSSGNTSTSASSSGSVEPRRIQSLPFVAPAAIFPAPTTTASVCLTPNPDTCLIRPEVSCSVGDVEPHGTLEESAPAVASPTSSPSKCRPSQYWHFCPSRLQCCLAHRFRKCSRRSHGLGEDGEPISCASGSDGREGGNPSIRSTYRKRLLVYCNGIV